MRSTEFGRRCEAIYEGSIRAQLEKTNMNDFVAVEPDSGEYFLGKTLSEASAAARAVHPDRQTFVFRVGHEATVHIGRFAS
jgi:hypothetical protein